MEISCDVIRDLLPLYAEDLVSEDSKKLVDDHLCGCTPCTKQLAIMKKAAQLPVEVDTSALKRVENTIRRKRVLAVLTVLMFMVTVVLGGALLLDARIYLTADQAVDSVELLEDGSVFIRCTNYVLGTRSTQWPNTKDIGFIAWSNLNKLLFSTKERESYEEMRQRYETLDPVFQTQLTEEDYKYMGGFTHADAKDYNVWYCSGWTGRTEKILWEGGNLIPTEPLMAVNYNRAVYCAALLVLAALLILTGRHWNGKWYGELCIRLAILCGCLCLSTVIVTAGQFAGFDGEFTEAVIDSTAVALPMTLTALFGRQLYLLNKRDKGE